MALMFPTVMLISNLTAVAVIWFGGHLVDSGEMQIGSLTALLAYIMQILMAVMMASFLAMMAPRAAVSADRIGEVLQTRSSVHPPANPQPFRGDPAEVDVHLPSSAIPARRNRCCTESASGWARARPPPSSAPPVRARPP